MLAGLGVYLSYMLQEHYTIGITHLLNEQCELFHNCVPL